MKKIKRKDFNNTGITNHIRKKYEEMGVEGFYEARGADYSNPHLSFVRALLLQNQERIDYSQVLDLCCGSGEVSGVLEELGFVTIACDPFTQEAFMEKQGRECQSWSFDDIIKGKIHGNFSSIICSFAMHLCPEQDLFALVSQLFSRSEKIIIITPHKRPVLEELDGVKLQYEDFVLTEIGKKVRLKSYTHQYIKPSIC